jgi:hypothetical protein
MSIVLSYGTRTEEDMDEEAAVYSAKVGRTLPPEWEAHPLAQRYRETERAAALQANLDYHATKRLRECEDQLEDARSTLFIERTRTGMVERELDEAWEALTRAMAEPGS